MSQWVHGMKVAEALGKAGVFAERMSISPKKDLQRGRLGEIQPIHVVLAALTVESDIQVAFDTILRSNDIKSFQQFMLQLESYYGINQDNAPNIIEGEVVNQDRLEGWPRPLQLEEKESEDWFSVHR